jgi:hypothetical protein
MQIRWIRQVHGLDTTRLAGISQLDPARNGE